MAHPSHDGDEEPIPTSVQIKNDFSLLELAELVIFTRDVHSACLPSIAPHDGTQHDIVSPKIFS